MTPKDISQGLSEYRRKRSLLSKAYRAAKRAGRSAERSPRTKRYAASHYLQAADILAAGKKMGVQVGGIGNSHDVRNEVINANLSTEWGNRSKEATLKQITDYKNSIMNRNKLAIPGGLNIDDGSNRDEEEDRDEVYTTPYFEGNFGVFIEDDEDTFYNF